MQKCHNRNIHKKKLVSQSCFICSYFLIFNFSILPYNLHRRRSIETHSFFDTAALILNINSNRTRSYDDPQWENMWTNARAHQKCKIHFEELLKRTQQRRKIKLISNGVRQYLKAIYNDGRCTRYEKSCTQHWRKQVTYYQKLWMFPSL